ncbi:Gfo/Idh/MocA family oxidoreductase [Bacillus sp. JJ1566]|uniref:Gfo/Idh/MocA family protein n=1 Tax=Bacillus sp. JJ1566 TaxID=3122961 RepID=UPI002FFEE270
MSSNGTVKFGLIGLGGMSNHHLGLIERLDTAAVGAICDVNEQVVNKVAEKYNVPKNMRFTEYEDVIKNSNVDAVISMVPNKFHAEIIRLCIQYGKPLLSEKPFTLTFKEADDIKELYNQSPIPCMVGFSYRYIPAFRYVKNLLVGNKLGTIRHISVQYLQEWGSPLFDVPYNWRFSKEISGSGALGDLGSHMIDTARYLIGEFNVVSSMMTTFVKERNIENGIHPVDVDDFTSFQAMLENGVIGNFVTSRNAIGYGNRLEFTIFGDYGTVSACCEKGDEVTLCLKSNENKDASFEKIQVSNEYNVNQLLDFIHLIQDKDPDHTPTFHDGYINQKIIDCIIQSSQSGRSVKVNQ